MPALWRVRRHISGQVTGSASLPVQDMREDVQRGDRHAFVGPAPQGQVACLRNLCRRGADSVGNTRRFRASAERCGFAVNTAFRWRHRFLSAQDLKTRKLTGIVEADETYVLESRKGARDLERAARRRGGKAGKRGLSDEQVPVLVAADRSGATVSTVLPAVNADTLRCAIEPVVDADIVLVTDGHRAYRPCAAALGFTTKR